MRFDGLEGRAAQWTRPVAHRNALLAHEAGAAAQDSCVRARRLLEADRALGPVLLGVKQGDGFAQAALRASIGARGDANLRRRQPGRRLAVSAARRLGDGHGRLGLADGHAIVGVYRDADGDWW